MRQANLTKSKRYQHQQQPHSANTRSRRRYLAAVQVQHLVRHLCRSFLFALAHLPDLSLQSISRAHRAREACGEVYEGGRVASANSVDDGTRGEPVRGQTVQDDAAEAGGFTNAGVCWGNQETSSAGFIRSESRTRMRFSRSACRVGRRTACISVATNVPTFTHRCVNHCSRRSTCR